ncbi:hypothetical protein, partial [Lactococcus petauri]|uniref:hypothetical protein n=1 Tax=Lactococcus petauri TaxID=1940789 RepID=UPI0021F17EA6
ITMTIETDDHKLTFDDSPEAKERIFKIALDWFKKTELYSGEALGQSDTTYVEAPDLLAAIAEEGFCFKAEWKD